MGSSMSIETTKGLVLAAAAMLIGLAVVACDDEAPVASGFGARCGRASDCTGGFVCVEVDPLSGPVCTLDCTAVDTACPDGAMCVMGPNGAFCAAGEPLPPPPGLIVSPCDDGQCEEPECRTDGECGDAEACVDGACQEVSGECTTDGDCRLDQACEAGACVPFEPTGCQADRFEPNDDGASSAAVSPTSYSALTLCAGESDDYYRVTAAAGDTIRARITFVHAVANLDMELLDPSGAPLLRSAGTEDHELVSRDVPAAGEYLIHVFKAIGSDGDSTYDLSVEVSAATAGCQGDSFEPNDTAGAASIIESGTLNAAACADDDDWYKVAVGAGATLRVSAAFDNAQGNLDLFLYQIDGQTLLDSSEGVGDTESVEVTTASSEVFLIRVAAQSLAGESPYSLTLDIQGGSAGCSDAFEPNDTAPTASPVTAGHNEALSLCADDDEDDYYSIDLDAGDAITVTLGFNTQDADIDLQLYDEDLTYLMGSASGTDNEDLTFTVTGTGSYIIHVYTFRGEGAAAYTMDIAVDSGAAPSCSDVFEPNDTLATAAPLAPGTYTGLALCDITNENDYYAVDLEAGERIEADAFFDDSVADLDMELFGPDGTTVLARGTSATDDESVAADATTAGTYTVRMYHYGGDVASYDLTLRVITLADPCNDRFEPNGTTSDATPISNGIYDNLGVCHDEDANDFYTIYATTGQDLYAAIAFDSSNSDLDLGLMDTDALSYLAVSTSETASIEEVLEYAPADGYYFFRVQHFSGAPVVYELEIDVY